MRIFKFDSFLYLAFLMFLLMFPLAKAINFMQSDDWMYYSMVQDMLYGVTALHRLSPVTFFSQGLFGVVFTSLFPVQSLPVLTLIVSIASFYVFTRILFDHYYIDVLAIGLMSLLFFFNPFNIYLTWGFMSDIYLLLMVFLAIYFIHSFEVYDRPIDFAFVSICVLIGFFVRQISIVVSLAFGIYLILKKNYIYGVVQLLLTFGLLTFFYLFFPRTVEMTSRKSLVFENLLNYKETFYNIHALLVLTCAFLFPLVFRELQSIFEKKSFKVFTLYVVVISASLGFHYYVFDTTQFKYDIFPYFGNTFTKWGFFPTSISGLKYTLPGIDLIFKLLEILGVVGVGTLVVHFINLIKDKKLEFNTIYIAVYFGVLLLLPEIYDRYLLFLIPVVILLFVQTHKVFNNKFKAVALVYVSLLMLISYQFSFEFVKSNSYVWSKATQITHKEEVHPKTISANSAWQPQVGPDPFEYMFSYNSPVIQRQLSAKYKVIDAEKIKFPFSMYKNSTIFLYELSDTKKPIQETRLYFK